MRTRLAALAVIGLAAALRIWGLRFGLPHTLTRPDEEAVFAIALQIFQRHFNPQFFDWPSLYLYAVGAADVLYFNIERLAGRFTYEYDFLIAASQNPGPLFLIARAMTAAMGTATVWLVYRIGLRLFDRHTALMAALFLAVVPLHARDSHFGVPDIAATALVAASFLFTARYWQSERSKDVLLAAMFAGLAASAKYNAGLVAVPALLAVVHPREGGWRFGPSQIRLSAIMCGIAMATFLIGTPYALLDWRGFLTGLQRDTAHLRAGHAALQGWAWRVHLTSSLWFGLRWPVLVAAFFGLASFIARDRRRGLLVSLFPLLYFAIIGAGQTAFARYIIPIVPFLCLAAAYGVSQVAQMLALRAQWRMPMVAWPLAILVAIPSTLATIRIDRLLASTDNRLIAAAWIATEFPDGTTLYQSGAQYGQVQMQTSAGNRRERYPRIMFNEETGIFTADDGTAASSPAVVVIQEHPLTYSRTPESVRRFLNSGYQLRASFAALDSADPRLVFDEDDAFYVPLDGFDAVARAGPNLMIYERK